MLVLFSLPCPGQPSPPGYYGGVTLQGPLAQTGVWKSQTCPIACLSVRRLKKNKKRERRRRKGREELCSWLHLPASVISIHCECKQNRAMKEEKTWTEWRRGGKKEVEEAEEEVGNSQRAKNILARCVRYKSPAHLLVALPDKHTHTHTLRQHRYGWQTQQLTEEPV